MSRPADNVDQLLVVGGASRIKMAGSGRRGSEEDDHVRSFGDGIDAAAAAMELDSGDSDGNGRRPARSGAARTAEAVGCRWRRWVIDESNAGDDAARGQDGTGMEGEAKTFTPRVGGRGG